MAKKKRKRRQALPAPGLQPELLTLTDVVHMTRLSKSSIYRKIDAGMFPPPVKLGPRLKRWKRADLADFIASRN